MIDINNLALFMLATITLNLTPGPDMMYVIGRSVSEGKKSGIASAFGIAAGTICHTLAVALGLSSLLLAVPTAYDIIRYIGGAYLVYLGIKMLIKKQKIELDDKEHSKNIKSVLYQGIITNIFNPKVALFFLAFLPQFIEPSSNVTWQIIFLGVLFNISGTIVNIIVALTASRLGKLLKDKLNNSSIFKWLSASVFIGLGIRLVLQERK
jgi:threonine/homoserine/homoserine lactone efflux protein